MLPRVNRLNKQKDFDHIFERGKTKQDGFLVIRFLPNHQKFSRFGLIVSARVAKKAVARNRLRRQLSEVLRLNLSNIKQGFDIVLVAKIKALDIQYRELEETLLDLLKKSNLYG